MGYWGIQYIQISLVCIYLNNAYNIIQNTIIDTLKSHISSVFTRT